MDNFTTEQERALVARLRAEKAEAERDDVMRHVEKRSEERRVGKECRL